MILFKINTDYLYIKVEDDDYDVIYKQLFKIIKYNNKGYLSYAECEDETFNILDSIYENRLGMRNLKITLSDKSNTFMIEY